MTVLVGVLCTDGVVIAADSAATMGSGGVFTVRQQTSQKITYPQDGVILAITGSVGLGQRLHDVVKAIAADSQFKSTDPMKVATLVSKNAVSDFERTGAHYLGVGGQGVAPHIGLGALLAFPREDQQACLIEYDHGTFQPELRDGDLWWTTMGIGKSIADPVLTVLAPLLCEGAQPVLSTGKFLAYWTVRQVINTNTGGVDGPVHMAVLSKEGKDGKYQAVQLTEDDIELHGSMVDAAADYIARFPEYFRSLSEDVPSEPSLGDG